MAYQLCKMPENCCAIFKVQDYQRCCSSKTGVQCLPVQDVGLVRVSLTPDSMLLLRVILIYLFRFVQSSQCVTPV